jgi:transposase InsO family protein
VAPSTYYAARSRSPSQRAQRDAVLGPALVQLWKDNYCVYGAHKLWKTARRAGHDVDRDQVARLMRAAGIEGVRRGKRVRTTKPDPGGALKHRLRCPGCYPGRSTRPRNPSLTAHSDLALASVGLVQRRQYTGTRARFRTYVAQHGPRCWVGGCPDNEAAKAKAQQRGGR